MANRKKSNKSWLRRLLPPVLVLLLAAGCIPTELNERSLVSMVGIDANKDHTVRLTLGIIATHNKETPDAITVYSVDGETLFDASRKFIQIIGNQPLWPYIKVIVLGPSVSKKDIIPVLDFFNRNNEIQPNPYVILSKIPAEEIVRIQSLLPALNTVIVEQQLINQSRLSLAPRVQLFQLNEMMYAPGSTGYMALIRKMSQDKGSFSQVSGMAVIKNGKWIGELGERETRGVLWVRHEVEGGILNVSLKKATASLVIKKCSKVEMKPVLRDGELSMSLNIKVKLSVGEIMGYLRMDQAGLEKIRQGAEKEIASEVKEALAAVQPAYKADIFGFGPAVERKYPKYWQEHKEQWESIFSKLPVDISVKASLHDFGLTESVSAR